MTGQGKASTLVLDAPVGSIMIYSGDCSNTGIIGKLIRDGWMPCDGSLLQVDEYIDLYNAIGIAHGGEIEDGVVTRFNLPNLVAYFVRGVNESAVDPHTHKPVDPDVASRGAPNKFGNTADAVGSLQYHATGRPTTVPFSTDIQGDHNHTGAHLTGNNHKAFDGASFYQAEDNGGAPTISSAGRHRHDVRPGGDPETRPSSLSLYYIIRVE